MGLFNLIGTFFEKTGIAPKELAAAGALCVIVHEVTKTVNHAVDSGYSVNLGMSGFSVTKDATISESTNTGENDELAKKRSTAEGADNVYSNTNDVAN